MNRSDVSFFIITMGCAKNEVDSAKMKQLLLSAGYRQAVSADQADAVLVNTCSFIQSATEESLAAIFDALDLPKVSVGQGRVIVCGCMPARYGNDLASSLTEVTSYIPCADETNVVSRLDNLMGISMGEVLIDKSASEATAQQQPPTSPLYDLGQTSAYIMISDGCDRYCSFCTIPYFRGRYHSYTFEQIEADVQDALACGARELILIAQDTGRWGEDLPDKRTLAWLVRELAERHPQAWIRVMYLQPEGITDELLEVMRAHDNVCSYLDMPLQHVNERILRAMHRKGNAQEFLSLIAHIRDLIPDIVLRTTFIAGFPGETDDDVDEILDFLDEAQFDYVGVFPFSCEEGTRAAELPDQIDPDECLERAQRIRDFADELSVDIVSARVGQTTDVLIEGREEDGQLVGRTPGQAPEVDGETYVDAGEIGDIVHVRIVDTMMYEMEGEVC